MIETGEKPFKKLNPHMRGVLYTPQLAYGLPVGESGETHLPVAGAGGEGAGLDETLRASLGVKEPVNENIAECDLDGHKFVWTTLRHPTRNWHSTKYPHFHEVIEPTLRESRRLALGLSQG